MKTPEQKARDLKALRRFATAITILNLLGHLVLGFEQAWIHPFIALGAAYGTEMLLECMACLFIRRMPRFLKSFPDFVTFLLPAHITGLAVAMLLYPNRNFMVIAFAAIVGIGSKALFRVRDGEGAPCHFLNPSNFGITVTLLVFPWVGVVPPYHFTENIPPYLFWLLPLAITCTGTLVNVKLTRKHPLILAWLGGFILQAWLRSLPWGGEIADSTFPAALAPMSGVAFILFTFYMISDPKTVPERWPGQVAFGAGVALAYGAIVASRGVFALFFALTAVCVVRGLYLMLAHAWRARVAAREGARGSALSGEPVADAAFRNSGPVAGDAEPALE